jgi:hypothetical protein
MAPGLQQTFRRGAIGKPLHAGTSAQSGVAVVWDRSGSPQNPLSDARVEDKFLRLAGAARGTEYVSRLLVRIRDVAALDDVARIHEWPTDPMTPTTMGARSR